MMNTDENPKPKRWPFIIQLPTICLALITVLGLCLPMTEEMKALGKLGFFLISLFAFPAGLTALIYVKNHAGALGNLEKPTKALAIINMILGGLLIVFFAFVFFWLIIGLLTVIGGIRV